MSTKPTRRATKSLSIWIPSGEIYQYDKKIRPHNCTDFLQLATKLGLQDDASFFFLTEIGNDLFLLPACYPRTAEELHTDEAKLYFLYHLCEKCQSDNVLILAPHKDSDVKMIGDHVSSNRKKSTNLQAVTCTGAQPERPNEEAVGPAGDSVVAHRLNVFLKSPDAINRLLSTLLQVSGLTRESVSVQNHDKTEFTLMLTRDEVILKEEALSWEQFGEVVLKKSTVTLPVFTKLSPNSTFRSFAPAVKGSAMRHADKDEGIVNVILHLSDAISASRLHYQINAIRAYSGKSSAFHQGHRSRSMFGRLNRWARSSFSCVSRRSKDAESETRARSHSPDEKRAVDSTYECTDIPVTDTSKVNIREKYDVPHTTIEEPQQPILASCAAASPTSTNSAYLMGIKPTMTQPVSVSPSAEYPPTASADVGGTDTTSYTATKKANRPKELDDTMFNAMRSRIKMGSLPEETSNDCEEQPAALSTFTAMVDRKSDHDFEKPSIRASVPMSLKMSAEESQGPLQVIDTHSSPVNISTVLTITRSKVSQQSEPNDGSIAVPKDTVDSVPVTILNLNSPSAGSPRIDTANNVLPETVQVDNSSSQSDTIVTETPIKSSPMGSFGAAVTSNEAPVISSLNEGEAYDRHKSGLPAAVSPSHQPVSTFANHNNTLEDHVIQTPSFAAQSPISVPSTRESIQPAVSPTPPSATAGFPSPCALSNETTAKSTTFQSNSTTVCNSGIILPSPWKPPPNTDNETIASVATVSVLPPPTVQFSAPPPTDPSPATSCPSTFAVPPSGVSILAPSPYLPQSGIRPPSIKPRIGGPSPEPPRRSTVSRLPAPGVRPETNGSDPSSASHLSSAPLVYKDTTEAPKDVHLSHTSNGTAMGSPETRMSGIRPPSVTVRSKLIVEQQQHQQSFIRPPSLTPHVGSNPPATTNGNGHSPSGLRRPVVAASGIPIGEMKTGIRLPSNVPKPNSAR